MHELVDLASFGIRSSGAASKNNVADQKHSWIAAARVDQFAMPAAMLFDEEIRNLATRG